MFAYCINEPVNRLDIVGYVSVKAADDEVDIDPSDDQPIGGGESRFSSHFYGQSGSNKPWNTVIESNKAINSVKGIKNEQAEAYNNTIDKLAKGDPSGLNLHPSKGGF